MPVKSLNTSHFYGHLKDTLQSVLDTFALDLRAMGHVTYAICLHH